MVAILKMGSKSGKAVGSHRSRVVKDQHYRKQGIFRWLVAA
jgi:hypothetical protein